MKKQTTFFYLMVCWVCVSFPQTGFCIEKYLVNEEPVLLYKIINWWHDCISNEAHIRKQISDADTAESLSEDFDCYQFCARKIKCVNHGNAQIEYAADTSDLKIRINDRFADLLIPLRQTNKHAGPSSFKCTWLNETYFGNSSAEDVKSISTLGDALGFKSVEADDARLLKEIETDIGIVLEGVICGLAKSKIILYQAGEGSKSCKKIKVKGSRHVPICLSVINLKTDEILAKYMAYWK